MIGTSTDTTGTVTGGDPLAVVPTAADILFPQPNPDGLTREQLENMLSDIRFQPKWRSESDKCADYYDGHQITQERLARMESLGIPPLVTNLIRPAIDAVLGLEAKARTDWRVVEEDYNQPVPELALSALNQKLTEAERESRADRAISDAHAAQLKAGLGWVEVARASDAMAYPYRVADVHRSEMWWDWRAKNPDLSDARYLIRKRRFDQDELIALMPEHAEVIKKACSGGFRTWQWETKDMYDPQLAYAAEVERLSNIDEDEWRDAERKRATLFEVWYRKFKRGLLLKLPNGKVIPYDEQDMRQRMAVQQGLLRPFEATYSEVRVAFYMGPHQLYDFKSPYPHRHFPYVPFWGFREDKNKIPYGLIRSMISPQDIVNSADAKMHWLLNARRLVAHSDAIDQKHNSWRQVQDELARPDAVVLLDPAKQNREFRVEQNFELNQQQFQRRMQAANDIENSGGIYKAMLGKEGGATSGIAINALVEQGSVTLAEIRDNYSFARRQVGELLFALVHEDLIGQETTVHVQAKYGVSGGRTPVPLNTPQPNGTRANNVALMNVKVVLTDVPSTPAFRAQQLQVLSEVVKSLPPEMQMGTIDVLIKLTDVPDKELLIERLRRMAGIQDLPPDQQEAQAAQAAEAQAEAEEILKTAQLAKIAVDEANAKKIAAETEEIILRAEAAEADLQDRLNGLGEGENDESLREQLTAALQNVQQLKLALQDKHEKLVADTALKAHAIDGKLKIDNKRAENEHKARMAAVRNKPKPKPAGGKKK